MENIPFVLGGVRIPHVKGSKGHSDADTLIHAICDALLGAANLGDIGQHFPDSSLEYKDIDSKILLKRTVGLFVSKDILFPTSIQLYVCRRLKSNHLYPKCRRFLPGPSKYLL